MDPIISYQLHVRTLLNGCNCIGAAEEVEFRKKLDRDAKAHSVLLFVL